MPNDDALDQAVEWLMVIEEGKFDDVAQLQFAEWIAASDANAQAWAKMEGISRRLDALPGHVVQKILEQPASRERRAALRKLLVLTAISAGGIGYWGITQRYWLADLRAAVGEQRSSTLSDGTTILLNSNSAADLMLRDNQREITLHRGELRIETIPGKPRLPIYVHTPQATIEPLGTIFDVRLKPGMSIVRVLRDSVYIRRNGNTDVQLLRAGQGAIISKSGIAALPEVDVVLQNAWAQGMLIADEMPLKVFAAELSRYRRGRIIVADDAADILISGAYPVMDPPRVLAVLADTYPLTYESSLLGFSTTIYRKNK